MGEAASAPTDENPEFAPGPAEEVFTARDAVELDAQLRQREPRRGEAS
jgi:hypothetical protein